MAGKHTAGHKARKPVSMGKILLIVLIVVIAAAAVVAALAALFGFAAAEPAESAEPVTEIAGEEAVLAAGDAPDEVKAPEAEPVTGSEEPVEEDPSDEVKAPEEEPVDEELFGPEVPGEESMATPPEADFAEIFEEAGVEPTYQLASEAEGLGYAVMARGNLMTGISLYEFLYDGEDRVVTMAETYYSFFDGATPEDMEHIAAQLLAESQPPEALGYVDVTSEIVDNWVVLRIRMDGLDEPAVVDKLSEIAFIPYTPEDYLYFTATHDRLVDSIGYAER